jgi:DNA-binding response OmpR family regulator
MKVLIVDENRKRRLQILDQLQKKKHAATQCSASGDFMACIDDSAPDRIILDAETWKKGRAMFGRFNFAKKLENIPILFYNVAEGATVIAGREPHARDRILPETKEISDIISAFEQNL